MRKLIFIAFNMHAAHGAYQQCREVSAASLCLADSPLPERELELELVLELELEQWLLSFVVAGSGSLCVVCFSSRIS